LREGLDSWVTPDLVEVLAGFVAATIEMLPESAVPPTNSSSTISVM